MTNDEYLSPMAALRSECLHLAVSMLTCCDSDAIEPQDAIRLAEEYVVWILEAGRQDAAVDPGNPVRSGSTASTSTHRKH